VARTERASLRTHDMALVSLIHDVRPPLAIITSLLHKLTYKELGGL
jgi:hypothetical protein